MTDETETVRKGGGYIDEDGNLVEWSEEVTQPKGTFRRELHEAMEFLSKIPPPTHMFIPAKFAEIFEHCENAGDHTPNTIDLNTNGETQ